MWTIDDYREQIEAALRFADDSHSFADVKAAVSVGDLQFWPGVHSVIITEVVEVPRYRSLNIFLAGGKMAELDAMLPEVENFAQVVGADRITLTGRKGWARSFLIDEGYVERAVLMEKRI